MVDQLEGSAVVAGLASRFRVDGRGTQAGTGNQLATILEMATRKGLPTILQVSFCVVVTAVEMGVR